LLIVIQRLVTVCHCYYNCYCSRLILRSYRWCNAATVKSYLYQKRYQSAVWIGCLIADAEVLSSAHSKLKNKNQVCDIGSSLYKI